MKIYFAAPLFSQSEKEFNLKLTKRLEFKGFKVFLPQRDGIESKDLKSNISKDEKRKLMFELDRDEIINSDIFLIILDGRVPDEGACVELGMAYLQKFTQKSHKYIIGLQTDIRAAFISSRLNPMIKMSLDYLAKDVDDLMIYLQSLS